MIGKEVFQQINLFSKKKDGRVRYYAIPKAPLHCSNCKNDLDVSFVLVVQLGIMSRVGIYCAQCSINIKDGAGDKYRENWLVNIAAQPPRKAIPIINPFPPGLKDSKNIDEFFGLEDSDLSVYEPDKIKAQRTQDNALISNRYQSIEGAKIGNSLDDDPLRKEIKNQKEAKAFLTDLKNAKPAIEQEDKERIGYARE